MRIFEMYPYLRVSDARRAIDFYTAAFDAVEKFRLVDPSGRIGHAELTVGPGVLMLSDAFPEYGISAPAADGVAGALTHLHVDDCDALARRAVSAGATLQMAPTDHFYGERSCRLLDPFGHLWLVGHQIEALTTQEMQRRYDTMSS